MCGVAHAASIISSMAPSVACCSTTLAPPPLLLVRRRVMFSRNTGTACDSVTDRFSGADDDLLDDDVNLKVVVRDTGGVLTAVLVLVLEATDTGATGGLDGPSTGGVAGAGSEYSVTSVTTFVPFADVTLSVLVRRTMRVVTLYFGACFGLP